MAHEFGGEWSKKKLMILDDYLGFYTKALKNQPFQLHYIDAFAGSGTHVTKTSKKAEGFWEEEQEVFVGSVRRALAAEPTFDVYHFNDIKAAHILELQKIRAEYPELDIRITHMDANEIVPKLCRQMGVSDRAILFLDPYATQVNWETVRAVAQSKRVDLGLLFPISALARMTPKEKVKIPADWKDTVTRLLGTTAWEDQIYHTPAAPAIDDMFGGVGEASQQRLSIDSLGTWVHDRLRQEFEFVSRPFELKNKGNLLFLFFLAVSNPEPKVHKLAYKVLYSMRKKEARRA